LVRQQGNGHLQRNTYHNLTREVTIRKRVALLSLVLIAVLLTGCSPRLEFSITPNPISVTFETEEIELEAKVKMYGFGSYKIEQAALEILDDQGEPVFEEPKVYDINKTVTVVPLGSIGKPVRWHSYVCRTSMTKSWMAKSCRKSFITSSRARPIPSR